MDDNSLVTPPVSPMPVEPTPVTMPQEPVVPVTVEPPAALSVEPPAVPSVIPQELTRKDNMLFRNLHPLVVVVTIGLTVTAILGTVSYLYGGGIDPTQKTPTQAVIVRPTAVPELTLSLASPASGVVTENSMLPVSGMTLPGVPVVFYTESHEDSVLSDEKGNFSGSILLDSGMNTLTITAMDENGQEKSLTMEVAYDDQVLGVKTENSNVMADKKAISGKVEKVSDKQLEVKQNNLGKSETVNIDRLTKVVNSKNKPIKINGVKPNDTTMVVASDDAASGAAKIKKAVKIFVKTATESAQLATKRKAVQGVVTNVSGKTITLAHQIQRDRTFTVIATDLTIIKMSGSASATLADVQVGKRITAVGDNDGAGGIIAKMIHIIPGKATGVFNKLPVTPQPTQAPSPTSTSSATPIVLLPSVTPSPTPVPPTSTPTPTEQPATPTP